MLLATFYLQKYANFIIRAKYHLLKRLGNLVCKSGDLPLSKIFFSKLVYIKLVICLFVFPMQVYANPVPGDACVAGQLNNTAMSGGPTTGVVHLLRCNGTSWQQLMTFNNGNIGMGVISPSSKLEVIGEIRIDNNPALGNAGCLRYNGTSGRIEFSHDCSNYSVFGEPIWSTGAAQDIYYNTGTPRVGIGTASPAYTLDVSGVIRTTDYMVVNPSASAVTPTFFDLADLQSVMIFIDC
jgi:hypothetical protein